MPIIIGSGTGGNAISINSSVGSSGQVITSNGSVASWGSASPVSVTTFTASGTWTKPSVGTLVYVEVWGGGGGGARDGNAGGGGGGAFHWDIIRMSDLGATVTVTIGTGGPGRTSTNGNGTNGGLSSFGSILAGGGGGGRNNTVPGAGGGWLTSANLGTPGAGYVGGGAAETPVQDINGVYIAGNITLWVGAQGGAGVDNLSGAGSLHGGGGGGGRNSSTVTSGGVSTFGGSGGAGGGSAAGGDGSIPAGGGGAGSTASGDGARGECRVYVW